MKYFLGVDLGTASIRVLALDENRNVVASSKHNTSFIFPYRDFVEQDPNEYWNLICKAISEIVNKIDSKNIECISLS